MLARRRFYGVARPRARGPLIEDLGRVERLAISSNRKILKWNVLLSGRAISSGREVEQTNKATMTAGLELRGSIPSRKKRG